MPLFRRSAVLGLLALTACATPRSAPPAPSREPGAALAGAAEAITQESVNARIGYLASDELRGRDTPSPGLELAAEYIADAFQAFGLQPAGDDGSFIQRWPYATKQLDRAAVSLSITSRATVPDLVYGRDFFVIPAQRDEANAGIIFLGRIDRLDETWPIEAAGKVAVVASGPELSGMQLMSLLRQAAAVRAAGVLLVLHPSHGPELVALAAEQLEGGAIESPVPFAGVLRPSIDPALRAANIHLEDELPASPRVIGTTEVRIQAPVRRLEHRVPNVVAVLPGSDPELRDEYVVLTAHMDHVGVGQPDATGDSIYNGADDDASGTTVVVEVAGALASLPVAPRRSVVFLLVSGEEKGLLGALHYVDHPTVPIDKVVANINLDMVGRNAPNALIAIGQEYTSLGPLAHRVARDSPELGLTILQDPDPAEQAFFRSDHVAFLRRDIPALFLTSWLHEDYHRPSDEAARIDADKVVRVSRLVLRMTHAVANDPARPTWLGDGLEQVRALLSASPF